jgi:Plasmid pRiA4b ORF-3-like protein
MNIYRVRVTLRQTQPPIWRRIELSGQTTLDEFHRILQLAMGWYNYHLHMFEVDGEQFRRGDSRGGRPPRRSVTCAWGEAPLYL